MAAIHDTSTPNISGTHRSICLHCKQVIAFLKDAFKCIICTRKQHILCTEGIYTNDSEVDRLKKGSIPFHFICKACTQNIKARDTSIPFTTEEISKNIHDKYKKLIEDYKTNEDQLLY